MLRIESKSPARSQLITTITLQSGFSGNWMIKDIWEDFFVNIHVDFPFEKNQQYVTLPLHNHKWQEKGFSLEMAFQFFWYFICVLGQSVNYDKCWHLGVNKGFQWSHAVVIQVMSITQDLSIRWPCRYSLHSLILTPAPQEAFLSLSKLERVSPWLRKLSHKI